MTEHEITPTAPTTPWRWLESTRELQEDCFGIDFMAMRGNRRTFIDYVLVNHNAAVIELSEAMGEVSWKPWANARGTVNRAAFIKELVDVAHFVANLAVAVDCTDDEWEHHYQAKQEVNRQRQAAGYDGVSTKCASCKRALDDLSDDHNCSER